MPDQKYIDELTERSRQYEALNNEMFPMEKPAIDVKKEIFGPREYPVEQFHSFGIEHPEDIAIAKALDLSPGMAATILPAIRAAKDAPHDEASLLADYGWHTGLAAAEGLSDRQQALRRIEATQRRAEAVAGAKAFLRGANIDFDVLPKTVLDLINVTASAKRRAYEAMPEAMKQNQTPPPRPNPGIDREALAEYNRTNPHAPLEVHPSWLG